LTISLPAPGFALQFHLLRHFNRVDKAYFESFIHHSGYSKEETDAQLAFSGSKFHYEFARNPLELFEVVTTFLEKGLYILAGSGNRVIYTFSFSSREFPDGIGTCNLLSIADLSTGDLARVRKERRGSFSLNIITGIPPRPTLELHLVIIKGGLPVVTTIFPGTYAPPLPDRTHQTLEEFTFNTDFWKKHALIK
jgi:hypothetical protein